MAVASNVLVVISQACSFAALHFLLFTCTGHVCQPRKIVSGFESTLCYIQHPVRCLNELQWASFCGPPSGSVTRTHFYSMHIHHLIIKIQALLLGLTLHCSRCCPPPTSRQMHSSLRAGPSASRSLLKASSLSRCCANTNTVNRASNDGAYASVALTQSKPL